MAAAREKDGASEGNLSEDLDAIVGELPPRLLAGAVPSLIHCKKLTVKGPARFQPNVTITGAVTLSHAGPEPGLIRAGLYDDASYTL